MDDPISDEIQLRRFDKFLETLKRVWWTAINSADHAAKQCKQFIKDAEVYSFMESLSMKGLMIVILVYLPNYRSLLAT